MGIELKLTNVNILKYFNYYNCSLLLKYYGELQNKLGEKMTEKILLMSDLHITEPGVEIVGLDPITRFRACLEHASKHHADASHLFLMGDLTHHGLDQRI